MGPATSERDPLARIYAALNNRDIAVVLAVMHPEVDWPNGMEGGRVHGHAGVREYWTRQWAVIDPRRFTTDDAGRTVVDVHLTIAKSGSVSVSFSESPEGPTQLVAVCAPFPE